MTSLAPRTQRMCSASGRSRFPAHIAQDHDARLSGFLRDLKSARITRRAEGAEDIPGSLGDASRFQPQAFHRTALARFPLSRVK